MSAPLDQTLPMWAIVALVVILLAGYVFGWRRGRTFGRREMIVAPPHCVACGFSPAPRTDAHGEPLCDQHYADLLEVGEDTWAYGRAVILGLRPRRDV